MIENIKRKIGGLFYALPFAMKAGDEIIAAPSSEDLQGTHIQQKIGKKSVLEDLLNGVVTQEVEEMRWQTYKVDELANDYTYAGNGKAVKKEVSEEQKAQARRKFIQSNKELDYGVQESLLMAESGINEYETRNLINIDYGDDVPKFRLERFMEEVHVEVDDENKKYITKLIFADIKGDKKGRPFINALKKLYNDLEELHGKNINDAPFKRRSELCSGLRKLWFITHKASNNIPNGIEYQFKDPWLENIEINGQEIAMTFKWKDFVGGQLLSEKFYSKSGEEKYLNHEKREGFAQAIDFSGKPKEEEFNTTEEEIDDLRG